MSLKQTAIQYFSNHIKILNSMAVSPDDKEYYEKLSRIYETALDALITVQKQEEEIKRFEAEIDELLKKNKILSNNADTAFQDGLNENQALFEKEILIEFNKKLEEKTGFRFNDTQEIVIPERVIREIFKEMEIEL
ncbi:MAG: hypothetical protein IJ447_02005 [Clostridia bacterium]|nr:hypothetical protein [Clostridia bacterium]